MQPEVSEISRYREYATQVELHGVRQARDLVADRSSEGLHPLISALRAGSLIKDVAIEDVFEDDSETCAIFRVITESEDYVITKMWLALAFIVQLVKAIDSPEKSLAIAEQF